MTRFTSGATGSAYNGLMSTAAPVEPAMTDRLATQAAALGLAAVFTVLTLYGVNALAERESAGAASAQLVAVQQVVVTGHRLPRS